MRKRLIIFLIILTIVFGGFIFYLYFPSVWGDLVYPLEFQDSIKKYSQEFGVDPNLVCAIIYSESRFNPESTSGVGARGLMQIMPATGASLARQLDIGNFSVAGLYDPDLNIRLGTFYIKQLVDKYGGNIELGVAAYNAGVPRVDSYAEGRGVLPRETSGFIRKVTSVHDMYNQIYGQWWLSEQEKSELKRGPNVEFKPTQQRPQGIKEWLKYIFFGRL